MVDQLERLKASLEDRYVVERELGRGGMATVYLAYDPKLRRRVAIKVLHPKVASAVGVERFEREIRTAAALAHPRILPVHESGQADGLFYYVMPHVEGESLRARLDREKQLPLSDALRIARQVARGLEYAHEQGVVHRDIKPANILLTPGGAVISDFGIARAISRAEGEGLTTTGLTVGTPGYMSPEQATGQDEIDGRSDLYSLGCVLYEMLVGERPFTGGSPQVILARQMAAVPSPVSTVRPALPGRVDPALRRLLARVPADRYRDAGKLISVLRDLEQQAGPESGEPAEAPGPVDGRRRGLRRLGILGAIGVAALVVILLVWRGAPPSAGSPTEGPGEAALDPTRIGILPFDVSGEASDVGMFARNLHQRLVAALNAIEPLTVVSGVGGDAPDASRLVRERRVGTLVHPTITAFRDSLEVRLQVLDAATSEVEATGHVTAPLADRLHLADGVADTLTALLRKQLGRSIRHRQRLLETESPEAYERVLSATEHVERASALLEDGELQAAERELEEADENLVAAERADPEWIEPIVSRGKLTQQRYLLVLNRRAEDAGALAWLRRGLEHAERALERDSDHAEALELRGSLLLLQAQMAAPAEAERLAARAENDLRAALQNARVAPRAMRHLSEVLAFQGQYRAALTYLRRAYEQDPFRENETEILLRLFEYSFETGRDSLAAEWCERGRRTGDVPYLFLDCRLELMAWSDVYDQDPDATWALVDSLLATYPQALRPTYEPHVRSLVAVVLARAGLADSARHVLQRAKEADRAASAAILPELAVLHHAGETDRALDRLQEYRAAYPAAWPALASDPRLRRLGLSEPLESGRR